MTFIFNPMIENATEEQKWAQVRAWRNHQLAATDWTQLADSPTDKEAWATYRQALRDLPEQGGLADDAEFPTAP
jgi:hypothetical protein